MKTALKAVVLVLCLVLSMLLVYEIHGRPAVGIDDANIFFSYSENFAAGKGMVYANNPERVEGFTSLLWMLMCAMFFKLGAGETAVLCLSVLLLSLTHILTAAAIGGRARAAACRPLPFQAAYLVMIALSAPYMTWMTITLMDTCLWGLIITVLAIFVLMPANSILSQPVAGLAVLLSVFVRPESMLVTPVVLLLIWHQRSGKGLLADAANAKKLLAAFFVTLAVLTGFRLAYFGYPLPNTWYAKVSPSFVYNILNGLEYLFEFVTSGIIVGAGLALLLAYLFYTRFKQQQSGDESDDKNLRPAYLHFAVFVLLLCILPVLTGGDHFALSRFYQPLYPLLCLALTLFFIEIRSFGTGLFARVCRHGAILLVVLAAFDYALFAWGNGGGFSQWRWESPLANEFRIAEKGIELGNRLNRLFEDIQPTPDVAVIPAGGIARSYKGTITDLLGLNHTRIAHYRGSRIGKKNHASFERELFFEMMPDILIGVPPGSDKGSQFTNDTLKGLLLDEKFVMSYSYGELARTDNAELSVRSFFRNDFVESLKDKTTVKFVQTMIYNGNAYVEKLSDMR
ncbi:MAG: hypothetical protein GQF41_2940 [Candidatus Rifleibacterium amylolyticum]|nr:MAG: hypothetical protein GQF41_2940 [Candidatus Rifleibacterium amylolyticum]